VTTCVLGDILEGDILEPPVREENAITSPTSGQRRSCHNVTGCRAMRSIVELPICSVVRSFILSSSSVPSLGYSDTRPMDRPGYFAVSWRTIITAGGDYLLIR